MQKYHFIAIGGAVMHQLAIMLYKQGNIVSGSDDAIFEPAQSNLAACDLLPDALGWHPERIHAGLDAIVLGMHAKADNPELIRAKALRIKIYSFPEFIFEQSANKKRIVVAGSHGKTTTTSMIMHILHEQHIAFDYLVGAKIAGFDNMVHISDADQIIIEGDEYLTSPLDKRSKFLHYHPHISILTGIAWDHINVFPTFESYLETFRAYIRTIMPGGILIYNSEDAEVLKVLDAAPANIKLVPYSPFQYEESESATSLYYYGKEYKMEIFGRHNISNLAAATAVTELMGIPIEKALLTASTFTGAARRLEKIFYSEKDDLTVYRDFAHAPSKVRATMSAVKEKYPDRRVVAILELHTYSSIQENFLPYFAHTLDPADAAIVFLDNEAFKIKGQQILPADKVIKEFKRKDLIVLTEKEELISYLKKQPKDHIVILLMSSGAFGGFSPQEFWNIKDS